MPIECETLKAQPEKQDCPHCDYKGGLDFLRGQVQSAWRRLFGRPYCAVICPVCKEVVDWEGPAG
jgi:hypothetical protein